MTERSEMRADLVGPSGDKMHSKPGNRSAFNRLIAGLNRFGIRFGMIGNPHNSAARIFDKPGMADGGRRLHDPAKQADIILLKIPPAEYILKNIQRAFVFCKEAKPACAVVQAMTRRRRERVRISLSHIRRALIREGCAAARICFDTDTGALVDQQNILIFVNNGKRGR